MSALVSAVITEAQGVLGEVAGIGVQTYGEDRMILEASRAFNLLFKKRFWPQLSQWVTVVLDGTTGVITTDAFENVLDFEDFAAVHIAGRNTPLSFLPQRTNPNIYTSGTTARFWGSLHTSHADYEGRKIKVYPITATGSIDVFARFHPKTVDEAWVPSDRMDMDKDLLVYGTAFMTLSSDDLNPGGKETCQNLMELRYKDIVSSFANHDIVLNSNSGGIPSDWQTLP